MAEKYLIQELTLAFPSASDIASDIVQMADGTCVFVTRQEDGEAVNVWYTTGSRTSAVLIYQEVGNVFATHRGSPVGSISLCVDNGNNIYLVGTAYDDHTALACRCLVYAGSLTWTPATGLASTQGHTGTIISARAVWCDTGGAGHLMVVVAMTGSLLGAMEYEVLDSGVAQAGSGTLSPVTLNDAAVFLGYTAPDLANTRSGNPPYDLENDGLGGTSGICAFSTPAGGGKNTIFVGGWAIDSGGALTTDVALSTGLVSAADAGTNIEILSTGGDNYVLIYPVTSNVVTLNGTGGWAYTNFTSTSFTGGPTSSVSPGSNPLMNWQAAKTHGWSAYWDGSKFWVLAVLTGKSGSHQNDVVALGASSGSGWDTVGTYIDTVGLDDQTSLVNVAVAPNVVNGTYQDFWVYALNSEGGFYYGDFVYLGALTPPNTPTFTVGSPDSAGNVLLTVTGSDGLPVNQKAMVQYSDDGGTTWTILPGFNYVPTDGSQTAEQVDTSTPPGTTRMYAAVIRNDVVTGVPVDSAPASGIGDSFIATNDSGMPTWLLKDPLNFAEVILFTPLEFTTNREESQGIFQPIGANFPVVITDTVQGSDGTLKIETFDPAQYANLEFFKGQQKTLLLQSPYGEQWYIRFASPRTAGSSGATFSERKMTMNPSDLSTPWRVWEQAYIEVAAPIA